MSLFDTIHFSTSIACALCGKAIHSVQVKHFESMLGNYYEKDCIAHAEEIRIIREELFCTKCSAFTGKHVYIVVVRGIVVGVTGSFEGAQHMLQDLNFEKLIFWYHDLFKRYKEKDRQLSSAKRFMRELVEWYEQGIRDETEARRGGFYWNDEYLKHAQNPTEAVRKYLEALDRDADESGKGRNESQ